MFSKPKEQLVIGITKTRLVANVIDREDIVDVALGNGGENRSFKGYTLCIVEQDDRQSLGEMLNEVIQKGCIKEHIQMGFIHEDQIFNIFERCAPSEEIKRLEITEWINTLDEIFSKNTIKVEFDQAKIFQNI